MSGRTFAVRPSVPPSVWLAGGAWIGVLASEWWLWACYVDKWTSRTSLALTVVALAAIAWLVRRHGTAVIIVAGLCAGLLCGGLYWTRWHQDVTRLTSSASTAHRATSAGDAREGTLGPSSTCRLDGGGRVRCAWDRDGNVPEYGETVEFYGPVKPAGNNEFGRRDHQSGVVGSLSARAAEAKGYAGVGGWLAKVRHLAIQQIDAVPGPGGALLAGVVAGDRRRLAGTSVDTDFRTTGLSHAVAVSGSHLVVVSALVSWALKRLCATRRLNLALSLGVLAAYVVISGAQASAIRAWLMAAVAAGIATGDRRGNGLGGLGGAACLALCVWPPSAFDLGFRLSVAAVAGLLVFSRYTEDWLCLGLGARLNDLAPPLAMTLVAQAATAPIAIPVFGSLSMVAPLANLIVTPVISVVLVLGVVGILAGFVMPSVGHVVLLLAGSLGNLSADIAGRLADVPYASILVGANASVVGVGAALCVAAVWVWWPRPSVSIARVLAAAFLALCAVFVVGAGAGRSGDGVTVMDVGQGDAVLVRSGSDVMLIDSGPDESEMRAALTRFGVRRLDWLVLTHLHDDHYGGLKALSGTVKVGTGAVADGAQVPEHRAIRTLADLTASHRELRAGDHFTLGDISVEVVWPLQTVEDPGANESCVVSRIDVRGVTVLVTGDAESEVLAEIVARGLVGDIDVLKVGHHGSADAVTSDVLAALKPEVAVISCGAGNRHGHPAPSTVSILRRSGARIVRTDLDGDVSVVVRDGGYDIETHAVAR